MPQLSQPAGHSRNVLFDFDGHVEASWGSFSNISTPAYDRDGDPTAFSTTELASINQNLGPRLQPKLAPFNVNATEQPITASFAHGQTLTVVIGGSWSDWYGKQANGGVIPERV